MLASWDRQLAELAADVGELVSLHGTMQLRTDRAFRLRTMELLSAEAQLDQRLDEARTVAERDIYLLPKEAALLHGARTLLTKLDEYSHLRSDLLVHGLWHNLLAIRLSGPQPTANGEGFGEDDVVSLAVRRGGLAQTERYLRDRLRDLTQHSSRLTQDYHFLDLADANRTAALSLGIRLGTTPQSVRTNPILTGLTFLLKSASTRVARTQIMQRLSATQARLTKSTDSLISSCRNLIVAGLESESDLLVTSVGTQLAEVEELDSDLDLALAAASTPVKAAPRTPILVQKTGKKAKTGTLGM